MICFHFQSDSLAYPQRLVWLAGEGSAAETSAVFDDTNTADLAALDDVADALDPTTADAVHAAEQKEATKKADHSQEHVDSVPVPVLQLVEAGFIKSPCTTADLTRLLDTPSAKLTDGQHSFLKKVLTGGESAMTTLNLQIAEYKKAQENFSVVHMREVVTRSHENLVEQGYSLAKDWAHKGLDAASKGVEKYPYAMLALAGVALYYLFTSKDKFGSTFWKWAGGITAGTLILPAAVDALRGAGVPYIGPRDATEKEAKEKEQKMAFLTGNLPPSFIQELRTHTADKNLPDDQGLLGFYELCQMSVSQFVDEMLKKDGDITDAEIGVNLGDQSYQLSTKKRYDLGKELIRTFGFDPDDRTQLEAFRARFGKDQKKLWMVAKVFPLKEAPDTDQSAVGR